MQLRQMKLRSWRNGYGFGEDAMTCNVNYRRRCARKVRKVEKRTWQKEIRDEITPQ